MYKYLISVIIPTRNRQRYAEAAARQILSLHQDIQVIVQDNSDDNMLEESFADLRDNKYFIYNHIDERISFVDNYELAVSFAEGEYFIALGDDDGLLSNITECVNWMKKQKIDAIKPSVKSSYTWPDPDSDVLAKREGVFSTKTFSGKIRFFDTRTTVIDLLKHGGMDYLVYPLAGTYHRIVRMDLLNEVKQKTGRYYSGLTPDMYSAISLSLLPNIRFAEIDYPISLPGVCPTSASAKSAKGEHCGKLETAPHFIGLKEPYIWDERIPKFYSVETIWGETLLKAIVAMKEEGLIDEYYKEDYLLYYLYKNNQNVRNDIESLLGKDRINSLNIVAKKEKGKVIKFFTRGINYILRRIPGNSVVVARCKGISEATSEVNKMIKSPIMRYKWHRLVRKSSRITGIGIKK